VNEPFSGRRLNLGIAGCIAGNLLLRAASAAAFSTIALYLAFIDKHLFAVPATFIGLLTATFYSTELITAPIFGALSDRWARRPFMMLGGVFGAVAVVGLPVIPAIPLFIVARLAEGLSSACSIPSVLGFLAGATVQSPAFRGRVMAAFEVATVLGFSSGVAIGGFLWDRQHTMAFYSICGIYLLAMAAFALVPRTPVVQAPTATPWSTFKALMKNRTVTAFIPAWVSVNAILGVWFAHLGFQMARDVDDAQLLVGGFSGTGVGLVSGGLALTFVVGTAAWASVFGRIKTKTIMALSLQAIAFCALLIYGLNHSTPDQLDRIWVLCGGIGIGLLIVSGFTPAALTYLAELSEDFRETRGGMMGLYSVLLGLGQLIGGWLGGYFAQAYAVDGLILLTVLLGLGANISILVISRVNSRAQAPSRDAGPAVI
jgi:MFS family permease